MPANAFELDLKNVEKSVINTVRAAIGVSGAVSVVIGLLILVWPVKTAVVVAGITAVYAVMAGVVNLAIGIFSRRLGGWARVGYLVLGAVFLHHAADLPSVGCGRALAAAGRDAAGAGRRAGHSGLPLRLAGCPQRLSWGRVGYGAASQGSRRSK